MTLQGTNIIQGGDLVVLVIVFCIIIALICAVLFKVTKRHTSHKEYYNYHPEYKKWNEK